MPLTVLCALLLALIAAPVAPQPLAELIKLSDDVYLFRSLGATAMFIVTDDGVVASDHIGQGADLRSGLLYKAAIASVTDRPVRYVVYHHDHADGITGMSVFRDTAQYVSQRLAAEKIAARHDPQQPVPTVLVDDQLALTLGGKRIELHYIGRGHTDNMLVTLYPARRLLWAGDFVKVQRLGGIDPADSYPEDYVRALEGLEQHLGPRFDTVVVGHGSRLGTVDDVRLTRRYYTDLMAAVRAARAQRLADESPDMMDAVRRALTPAYGAWEGFAEGVPANVHGLIQSWKAGR